MADGPLPLDHARALLIGAVHPGPSFDARWSAMSAADRDSVDLLVGAVGQDPLGLRLVAGWIAGDRVPFTAALEGLTAPSPELDAPVDPRVIAAWRLARGSEPGGRRALLTLLSWFGPEPIPSELMPSAAARVVEIGEPDLEAQTEEWRDDLVARGLLWHWGWGVTQVPPQIRTLERAATRASGEQWLGCAVYALAALPPDRTLDRHLWATIPDAPRWTGWVQLALRLARTDRVEIGPLLLAVGARGERLLRQILDHSWAPDEDRWVQEARVELAQCLVGRRCFGEAGDLLRRALAAQEATPELGPTHPDTTRTRELLVRCLRREADALAKRLPDPPPRPPIEEPILRLDEPRIPRILLDPIPMEPALGGVESMLRFDR